MRQSTELKDSPLVMSIFLNFSSSEFDFAVRPRKIMRWAIVSVLVSVSRARMSNELVVLFILKLLLICCYEDSLNPFLMKWVFLILAALRPTVMWFVPDGK